jgi:nucleoside-diphosphate-sugar epimerase
MLTLSSFRLTKHVVLRIVSDALMINVAVLIALVIRFSYLIAFELEEEISRRQLFWSYSRAYRNSAWLLTIICLGVFFLSGFYTYGRAYRGRYKALVVAQGVGLSYLLFGFFEYFVGDALQLPRGALVLAWLTSMCLLIAARLWSLLWRNMLRAEQQLFEQPEQQQETHSVLVIGGAGYIGSALLPKLLNKGYKVRLLDLLLYGAEPIQDVQNHPNLEVVQADFRHVDKVVEAMRGVDAVIHLGAIVGDPACALDHELTIEINLMATRMIAEVAKGSNVSRFIFASTCSVYGASDEILDEHSILKPVSLYARSKIASEHILMQMANDSFAPVCLRFGTIYGLSSRTRFDLVVNLLTAKAVVDGEITIFGGDQWRPFLHVDDAALALLTTLESPLPLTRNEIFNVGSDEQNYTLQQIGDLILRMVPTAHLVDKGSGADLRNYRVNFSKIRRILGFVPQWTIEQGIRQVIELAQNGSVQNYQDAKYSNVKFLNEAENSQLITRVNGWAQKLLDEPEASYSALAKHRGV